MYRFYIFIIASFLILQSCKDKEDTIPVDTAGDQAPGLNLAWQTNISDGELAASIIPIVVGDYIIYSNGRVGQSSDPIQFYDKSNGNLIGTWNDYVNQIGTITFDAFNYLYEGVFVFSTGARIYAINVADQSTKWVVEQATNSNVSGIGEDVFFVGRDGSSRNISKINIQTGVEELIISYPEQSGYLPILTVPVPYLNQSGETILVYTNNWYRSSDFSSKPELVVYNLSQNTLLFTKVLLIEGEGKSIPKQALLHNDKFFVAVGENMFCVDRSGTLIWQKGIDGTVVSSGYAIHNEQLYVHTDDGQLQVINPENGIQLWKQNTTYQCSHMSFFEDHIYFAGGNGNLYVLKAEDGEEVLEIQSPNNNVQGAYFESVFTLDEDNKRVYVIDFLDALCYKIE